MIALSETIVKYLTVTSIAGIKKYEENRSINGSIG